MKLSTLNSGLVAHLPLDEASLKSSVILGDKTPRQNDGISANAPNFVADRMGQIRAMQFNGTTDYVDCGNDESLDLDDDFSISVWLNFAESKSSYIINNYAGAGAYVGQFINLDGNPSGAGVSIRIYIDDNVNPTQAVYATLNLNQWYHIVARRDKGNTLKLYINGVEEVSSVDITTGSIINDINWAIGTQSSNHIGEVFKGSLADVRIYKRAITPAEITMLFQEYRSKISLGTLQRGLVLDMPLKNKYMKSATILTDRTPYCISPDTRGFFGSGFIRADEVKEGDTILQYDGKYGEIKNIIPSHFKGELIKIKARGTPSIKLTPPHKVLIVDGTRILHARKTRTAQKYYNKVIPEYDFTPEWVNSEDIRIGDYLIIPKPILEEKEQIICPMKRRYVKDYILDEYANGSTPQELIDGGKYSGVLDKTIRTYHTRFNAGAERRVDAKYFEPQIFDEEWAEIFGWWVAEGSLTTQPHRGRWDVIFSLGYSETEEAERIQYLLHKKTGKLPNINAHNSSITITTHNKSLVKFLCDNFGRGAINKKLPEWLLNAPNNVVRAFLLAYNKGDGCVINMSRKGDYDYVAFQTASPKLVSGVSQLLMKLGICPNIWDMNTKGCGEIRKGEPFKQHPAWNIVVTGKDVLILYPYMKTSPVNTSRYLQDENNFYGRVSKLELIPYEGTVYDFETETHTLGMPFVIHNSNDGTNSGTTIGADYATFNGTSDNIRIPDSESLSPTSAMTAMCWVKGAAQVNKSILTQYENLNQRAYLIGSTVSPGNKPKVIISDNGTYDAGHIKLYNSSIVVFDNTWHLAGFSFDGGTLKLFVDGVEDPNPTKTTDDAITTIHNSTADVMLGCYLNNNTPISLFAGDIAKARIYNRALTPAEWLLTFEKQKGEFL